MTKYSFYMGLIKTGACDWAWYIVAFGRFGPARLVISI